MARIIYLAGDISPDTLQQYCDAEVRVANTWFGRMDKIVLNPALLPEGLPGAYHHAISNQMMVAADTVVMLDGWQKSPRGRAEYHTAVTLGKMVFHEFNGLICAPSDNPSPVPVGAKMGRGD